MSAREPEALAAVAAVAATAQAARPGWWALLHSDAECVLARDPAARSRFEVWTIYPGLQALALHRLAHALWKRQWRYAARWLSFAARLLTQIDIHPGADIGSHCFIDHGCGVVIGETAVLGDHVTLYHGVTLGGTSLQQGKRHPTLGSHLVVGAGAKILGPITLGDRVRVAANSVVIESVPTGATVVGIPGRVVVPARARSGGLDLNHHLIPDPVGKAIACLLERVVQLEHALQAAGQTPPAVSTAPVSTASTACAHCDESCSDPRFDGSATHPLL